MYEHLEEARLQYGYTLDTIGKAANLSMKTIGNKIRGIGEFTFEEACAIHDRLFPNLDLRWLFTKSQEVTKHEHRSEH